MKVVVVGQGYVGLPLSMEAVAVGHDVVGIEINSLKAEQLSSGKSHIEDISDERISDALKSGRYEVSSDYDSAYGFDIAIITVPTPLKNFVPDLSFVESATHSLAPLLTAGATVVLESTTYPGTTREIVIPILELGSGLVAGVDFHVGYSPERIDPGNLIWGLSNTPKIVSGLKECCVSEVHDFYSGITTELFDAQTLEAAELAKILENTYRAVNIALVNEFAIASSKLGIDLWDAIAGASTKPFGFVPFSPGPGVGGHCLPIDPAYFSWKVEKELGEKLRLVDTAARINASMPAFTVQRISEILASVQKKLSGARALIIGLAYKKNTGDLRESPSMEVVKLLNDSGTECLAIEPFAPKDSWPEFISAYEGPVNDIDIVVILTDHDEVNYQEILALDLPVLDARHRTSGLNVQYL